jgi:hypothetical protein
MKLHEYQSYEKYHKAQASSFRKEGAVWVSDKEIDLMSDYIKTHLKQLSLGICHGVRSGAEVERFKRNLKINVIGTDLFREQGQPDYIVQIDFHQVKPEWIEKADFIYSNSLDHSYDPRMCLYQWKRCLRKGGLCLLHWSVGHCEVVVETGDCFAASEKEYGQMMKEHFKLKAAIRVGRGDHGGTHSTIFVGQKRKSFDARVS